MSDQSLYDEDILLWSEQQAEAIRRLGRAGSIVPNDLDIENVAEEIESVGRSELAAVESNVRQALLHLIKLHLEPDANAARHWRGEIFAFGAEARRRFAASMRQRIVLDEIWASAREELLLKSEGAMYEAVARLPPSSPVTLDELLAARPDIPALVARLRDKSSSP